LRANSSRALETEGLLGQEYFCRIQEARKKWPRAYLHWKRTEDQRLTDEFIAGTKMEKLSKLLQRQPNAIQSRLKALGLLK
jgi:hypothetical protein